MNKELKTNVIAVVLAVVVVAAIGSAFLLQPALGTHSTTASTTRPCEQKAYYDGVQYCFAVVGANTNASEVQLASANIMYVVTYPQLNSLCSGNLSSCKPQALPSGYSPQCNPCTEEAPAVYHDHVLAQMPVAGSNASYAIVVVAYAPPFSGNSAFVPMKSSSAITAGESAGNFAKTNPTAANPYEMHTRTVLVLSVYPAS